MRDLPIVIYLVLSSLCCFVLGISVQASQSRVSSNDTVNFVRPVPELPKIADASEVGDIFSYSMLTQTQCTLFQFKDVGTPVPWLVKSFEVSSDQKIYSIRIHDSIFHDGSKIESRDIKKSLEASIAKKAVNFEAFSKILGYKQFNVGSANDLKGIVIKSNDVFEIHLESPDSQLPAKLTDIRFSIRKIGQPQIGCGPYKIQERNKQSVHLSFFDSGIHHSSHQSPTSLTYVKMSKEQALSAFKSGKVDDLSSYVLTKAEETEAAKFGNITEINFPRTYFLAINAKTIRDRNFRSEILSFIQRQTIIEKCYPEQKITNSLVPPGFLGFNEQAADPYPMKSIHRTKLGKRKLRIRVISSVGSEQCVLAELANQLGPNVDLDLREAPISEFVDGWDKGKLDGIFAYMEGETTFHYFGSFNPKTDLSYGDPEFKDFEIRFQKIDSAPNSLEKQKLSQALAQDIIERKTLMPFFHFKGTLLVSRRFKVRNQIFTSPALTSLTQFEVIK